MHSSLPFWVVPVILIVLSVPLILGKVPRNRLYGFRTAYTMSSEKIWYRANKIGGIAVLTSGLFWLAIGWLLPAWMGPTADAYTLVQVLGMVSLLIAIVVSMRQA
jgi:hypothetical protein